MRDEVIMNVGMNQQTRSRVADLPGIVENAHDGAVHRCIHIRQIGHENLWALPASLKRDPLQVGLTGIDHQLLADRR